MDARSAITRPDDLLILALPGIAWSPLHGHRPAHSFSSVSTSFTRTFKASTTSCSRSIETPA